MIDCILCEKIQVLTQKDDPGFIHEYKNSILILGEHQYYPGYSVLILKQHIRELHEMPMDVQIQFFQELMHATRAIAEAFHPRKINHASLGNVVEHVHWHIFPRYQTDPEVKNHPWINADKFDLNKPDANQLNEIVTTIRKQIIGN